MLNYYRTNSTFISRPETLKITGSDGMFILGQRDIAISQKSCVVIAKKYPKIRVEIMPNAIHFLHQDAPKAVNNLIREFLGPTSKYSVETVLPK